MALTKTQVSELYVAIFNRASEGEGNQYWQGLDGSAAEIAALMLATPAAQAYFGDSLDSDQAFIEHIYLNTLGKTYADDAEGIDYWVGRLEAGEDRGALVAELVVAAQHPDYAGTPAQQQFLNRVEVSDYTADTLFNAPADFATSLNFGADLVVTENPGTINAAKQAVDAIADVEPGEPGEPGVEGDRFQLTDGRDFLTGTAGDDIFMGFAGQNQNGTIANAFGTGDFIDGGAGRDKIEATVQSDLSADMGVPATINARTVNVEEVHFEALPSSVINGYVVVDAGRMDSVEEFWSDNSSADLVIQDVRLGSKLNITKDVTFGLRDTDYSTDFTALFDSQSLVNAPATASNSALSIRIADVSTETVDTPLANVNLNLSFTLGSETITLQNVQADGGTYLGLVTAIRTALAEAGHPELNVSVGETYEQVTFAGNTVTLPFTAQEVFITDPNGNDFANVNFTQSAIQPVQGGFLVAGNADPVDPSETTNLIESNLILDNAGRGSTAGDVFIGGMSNSGHGVQQFNVTVDRSSKIESLFTSNGTLQNIVIDSMGANGSLVIGATQANLREIDANDFAGASLTLGTGVGGSAVENLTFLDAGQTTADVTFVGENYGGRPSAETNAMLLTGSGDDVIELGLHGVSSSGSTYTSAAIVTGAGNDVVTVFGTDDRNGAHIDTGTGNDTIHGLNISTIIEAGAGNDVIYAENTGDKAIAQLDAGSVYSTTTGAATANAVSVANLLNGRTVTVTVAMPEESPVVAALRGVDGFEVSATINASNGYLTTERDLYEAAARAINENAYVNKLVQASVDSNGHLQIEYLVDGATAVGDALVELKVSGAWTAVNANLQNNILAQVRQEYQDSNITLVDLGNAYNSVTGLVDHATTTVVGTDSWSSGSNTVNGGAGNDVIVLSSNDTGPGDTVVFDQGGFGYDYIVHFNDVSGGDVLDFSAWLDNVTSHSGSVASQVRIDGDVAAVGSITANQVAIANFTDLNAATGVTFANITDAQVLAALNDSGTAFGVGAAHADLVGNVQKSILMIQNDANLGVYKVYEVTSGKAAADGFATATLVGTVDFGDELGALDDTNIA